MVRITDCFNITSAVYRGNKAIMKQTNKKESEMDLFFRDVKTVTIISPKI